MPANLPPEYFDADKRYKEASTPSEKIFALEALIATVPKHKGTDKLRADLRRKLSKLREEAQKKKKGGRGALYTVSKEGASQAALVGFTNSGKSSILASITNAAPVIAAYPITTVMPLPGMMPFEDIQFQIVDLPPLGNESTDGWVSGILRQADLLLLIIDLSDAPDVQAELLIEQLQKWNIPINGIEDFQEHRAGVFKRSLIIGNKEDLLETEEDYKILKDRYPSVPTISISTLKKTNLESLKKLIFDVSDIIRVYTKAPGKEPDLSKPFTIPRGATVLDLAGIIHKDFIIKFKYARIWGSARFDGQRVQKDYILKDRDIVELHD